MPPPPTPAALARRPFVLIVRDGWGQNPHPEQDAYNAIKLAQHPVDDRLMRDFPHVLIHTSGEDVGLPAGVMGNSEVGHQNIGAGRIVDQETMRITNRIRDGSFFKNQTLLDAFAHGRKNNSNVHILGLCSDGRVHSDQEHAYALLEMARQQGFSNAPTTQDSGLSAQHSVFIHAITDGRDTAPTGAARYLPALEARCKELGVGRIATVIGRFYAMDRDNRWERVQTAYELLTENKGDHYPSATEALQHYYANASDPSRGGDEFVTPSVIGAGAKISDNDTVLFFNYRGDRPREITKAFVYNDEQLAKEPNGGFKRSVQPKNLFFATMAAYETGLPVHVIFEKPPKMPEILGAFLAEHGLSQFRSAETEKFPHVTFFFNDYREDPFWHEDRGLAPSPKDVKTYDLKPEMSAYQVCDIVLTEIAKGLHDVYIVNFANGDMVGHTGKLPAAIKAVEVVDACVGKIVDAVLARNGNLIVTADHGNCEQMWDPIHNCPHTSHTTYDVPLIVVDEKLKGRKLRPGGRLADVAPTALQMMGFNAPPEMLGKSLLE